jgi:AcrR family transcriptional regulator
MSYMTLLDALSEGPARLPGGEVAAAQRRRLVAAMVAAAAEVGYANVSIADVVARARVSRATFYEQFDSKLDCFLEAFSASVAELLRDMGTRAASGVSGPERVRALLAAYLEALAAFPEIARLCLVEIYAAGAPGAQLRRAMQAQFVTLLRDEAAALAAVGEPVRMPTDFELELFVGGLSSLVTTRVAAGEGDTLGPSSIHSRPT